MTENEEFKEALANTEKVVLLIITPLMLTSIALLTYAIFVL